MSSTQTQMYVYNGALETIPNGTNMSMVRIIPTQTSQVSIPTMKGCYSFSIDNSGSMNSAATVTNDDGDKVNHGWSLLDIAKHATNSFISSLDENDWSTISTYSDATCQIIGWTQCNEDGKKALTDSIMSIIPESSTNMVAGINGGLDQFNILPPEINSLEYNLTMILTTDGLPSTFFHPARGIQGYKLLVQNQLATHSKNKRQINVVTIGLGENLDSMLLTDISSGSGEFLHLPDPGSVGPFIVNLVAQCRSIDTFSGSNYPTNNMYLRISPSSSVKSVPGYERVVESYEGDYLVPLKNVMVDSPRHIVFEKISADSSVRCALYHKDFQGKFNQIASSTEDISDPILVSLHTLRQMSVKAMLSNFNSDTYNDSLRVPIENILGLVRSTKENVPYSDSWENMFMTLANEVLPGVQTAQNYSKWGRHYLRTLSHNLRREIRTNFRDVWMQDFTLDMTGKNARFEEESNKAETIFASTLAPPPSLLIRESTRGYASSTPRPQTVLPDEFMRGGGCFAPTCTVDRWNGAEFETITMDQVRPHDELRTPSGIAEVRCVVKTHCVNEKAELVTINHFASTMASLQITSWHPIKIGGKWMHPATISTPFVKYCPFVYNFVLHNEHILEISGMNCVTLGHGFKGPVVEHEYWGYLVINDLMEKNGWESGYVVLKNPLNPIQTVVPKMKSSYTKRSSSRLIKKRDYKVNVK